MDIRTATYPRRCLAAHIVVLASCVVPSTASGRGEETFGNAPLSRLNYRDWPGIMPLLKHGERVYYSWVNGNENFYYSGGVDAFNDALRRFAAAELDDYQVVLRPGPGVVTSFRGDRRTEFSWHVNLAGGIVARSRAREAKSDLVWNPHPTLSLYVTEETPLDEIVLPQGITLLELADVSQRVREGLASTDRTVRGWGAFVLARLDPYDEDNISAVINLLDDDDDWVRLNAVGAIAAYGRKARAGADALQRCLTSDNADLRKRAQQTLDQIESADDVTAAERQHRRILERIKRFREAAVLD